MVFKILMAGIAILFSLAAFEEIIGGLIPEFFIYAVVASFFFYLTFRKQKIETKPLQTTRYRKGISIFVTIFILGIFGIRWLALLFGAYRYFGPNTGFLEFVLSLPIVYTIVGLIWNANWKKRSPLSHVLTFIAFVESLIFTPFTYEWFPTPIIVIIVVIDVILWKIQTGYLEQVLLKSKNMLIYKLYNFSSPFWTLWINGYKNEGSGSHNYYGYYLYIVGAVLLILCVLKKDHEQTSLSYKDIQQRKKDYDNLLANHLITTENYEKVINQLKNLS